MVGAMVSLAKLLSLSKKPSDDLARDGAAIVRSFLDHRVPITVDLAAAFEKLAAKGSDLEQKGR
jgi:hypothetical protein